MPASVQSEIRPKLEKKYSPTATGAKLVTTFACDPIGRIADLTYESGSGHGQDLAILRLRWRDRRLEALRITKPSYMGRNPGLFRVERGDIDSGTLDARLPAIRGLLLAKLTEKIPPDTHDGSGSGSSNDWHGLLQIQDEAGHVLERGFTGYSSTSEQLNSIPMAQVEEILDPIIESIPWQTAPVDVDARAFFVSRFFSAGPESAKWWVKERFVILAEHVGTPALVPKLLELATTTDNNASVERTREYAVNSLAALSGFDARRDARGAPVPIKDAAAAYVRACRR